jgi:hypothetical protein
MTSALKSIADNAVAADGGSLLLVLEWSDEHLEALVLNRVPRDRRLQHGDIEQAAAIRDRMHRNR